LRIPFHEVFVDRDNVNRDAGQRRGSGSQGGGQRFSFPGFHLRQLALQQTPPPHYLGIVVPQTNEAIGHFTDQGKGLGTKRIGQPLCPKPAAQITRRFFQLSAVQFGQRFTPSSDYRTNFGQIASAADHQPAQPTSDPRKKSVDP
jgi:hypothetical protein